MAGFFINTIFSYFTARDKRDDVNKDGNDKGTLERFNETIGEDIDVYITPLIRDLLKNIDVVNSCFDRYVPYLESELGQDRKNNTLFLSTALPVRRNVLQYIIKFYNIRGTKRCYHVLLGMMNITAVINEYFGSWGFDSSVTFDDPVRRFDNFCPPCSDYSLELTGAGPMTPEMNAAIRSIIVFNQPINARLRYVNYNGVALPPISGDFDDDWSDDFLNE